MTYSTNRKAGCGRCSGQRFERTGLRLQAIWEGVKDALRAGDVTAALQYVHSTSRDRYQTFWSQLPEGSLANIDLS